jgi:hypothetical protein
MVKRVVLVLLFALALPGCTSDSFRVFQAKVPPPVEKTAKATENERRAADLIAREIQTPVVLKPVAQGLSESLGKPDNPLPSSTPAELQKSAELSVAELTANVVKLQKQIEAQNKFLAKYAGKEIEGTGFSMFGPGMTVVVLALIALAIFCPPALTLMFFAFRRLKAAAGIVVNEVENAAKSEETKAAVEAIKAKVAESMQKHKQPTTLLKGVITNLKK